MPEPALVYRLTFRSVPNSVPVALRVRRLLKAALRGYGIRCGREEEIVESTGAVEGLTKEMARAGDGVDA